MSGKAMPAEGMGDAEAGTAPKRGRGRPKGFRHTPERREQMAEKLRQYGADPAVRARRAETARRAFADPDSQARRVEAIRRKWADPEFRARMLERLRESRGFGASLSPEGRKLFKKLRAAGIPREAARAEVERDAAR